MFLGPREKDRGLSGGEAQIRKREKPREILVNTVNIITTGDYCVIKVLQFYLFKAKMSKANICLCFSHQIHININDLLLYNFFVSEN